jgi:Zn finger protein HypA/HybF involved in hydrogenase expression
MNREVVTFEAKCKQCATLFAHPSLGDFAYGEIILNTIDGKHHAWVNGFAEFPERVSGLLCENQKNKFWDILGMLSDEIEDQILMTAIICPHCSSQDIEYCEGARIGLVSIPEVSFVRALKLDNSELMARINKAVTYDA